MDRRIFIAALASLPFSSKAFAAQAWRAKFVKGQFDGTYYQAGLYVELDKGWKTYWRNPGEAGIPPAITAEAANLDSMRIDFPLPKRFIDETGESIAFHEEVLFPLYLKPKDASIPFDVKFSAFFGVCEQVCTPAKIDAALKFSPNGSGEDTALISTWQAKVPKLATIVSEPRIVDGNLVLNTAKKLDDLFVEGPDRFYFRKPDFEREAGKAWIKIDGLKKAADIKGADLRVTAAVASEGLEQHITLA
jgi:DsbC/DsbD-like thiol-disulfide interchange protein